MQTQMQAQPIISLFTDKTGGLSLTHGIKQLVREAVSQAYPDDAEALQSDIEITQATQRQFGHFQCNSAMKWVKKLKTPPRDIATELKTQLEVLQASFAPNVFAKLEIAGPGFINLTLSTEVINLLINHLQKNPLVAKLNAPKKVILDFSSPNIAKDMHVGHLRSTILGDCLARIFEAMGYDTLRLNHLGDWGTQFGMIIAYLREQYPDFGHDERVNLDISDLVSCYRQAKLKFDEDETFKTNAQHAVVELQRGDPTAKLIWEKICHISKKAYQEIYQLLDVKLEDRGESYYNPRLADTVKMLEAKGLVSISDGAKCIYVPGYTNRDGDPLPLIIQKSDGGYNYATTDLAALQQRVHEEHGDWLIYITDAGQQTHFNMVFEAGAKANIYDPAKVRIDHVPFGLVLREDGKKFKTRSGDTEKLIDLLHTAIEKAKSILIARDATLSEDELNHRAQHLGINAIKYADLSNHRTSDYRFSYERMLQFEGNTSAFLNYAYARIRSIERKIDVDLETLQQASMALEDPEELELALLLLQFHETLRVTIQELLPHRLTDYLYKLAEKFHVFFHHCRVEGSPQQESRVLLCDTTAKVLACGFSLLGLTPLEKM